MDEAALRGLGLANGRGQAHQDSRRRRIDPKLTVSAHAFSASAKAKIEKLGGACEVIEITPPAKTENKRRSQANETGEASQVSL